MNNFLEPLIPLFGIIFTFGIPGFIIFWVIQNNHIERMKIIEKGFTPEEARAFFGKTKPTFRYSTLKWGIIFAFVGLAVLISYVLTEVYDMSDSITFGLILLFGGIGFIVYFIIMHAKMKKEKLLASNNLK